jgi:NAD(P)-dependent dehydrogenase (short-subunit alcohol dehydrogenase family)
MSEIDKPVIGFEGQVAIVTGAGAGIGRETALLLAARGASVLVNDPSQGPDGRALAQTVVDEILSTGGRAIAETSAVGAPDSARTIADLALDRFGRIDVLVNNAGISRPAPFGEDSDDDIDLVLAVNLRGPYALMRAVWPVMQAQGYGRILNTVSTAALGSGISGAYAPSKAGLIGLTKDAAISGNPHGILVNALMPTAHTALLDKHPDPEFRRWIEVNFPARLVAATNVFVVSNEMQSSGEIFASGGGLVQRIAFHETRGFIDKHLTPESMRESFDVLMDVVGGEVIATQADHSRTVSRHFPR